METRHSILDVLINANKSIGSNPETIEQPLLDNDDLINVSIDFVVAGYDDNLSS